LTNKIGSGIAFGSLRTGMYAAMAVAEAMPLTMATGKPATMPRVFSFFFRSARGQTLERTVEHLEQAGSMND
jgi:hypothetical protein